MDHRKWMDGKSKAVQSEDLFVDGPAQKFNAKDEPRLFTLFLFSFTLKEKHNMKK